MTNQVLTEQAIAEATQQATWKTWVQHIINTDNGMAGLVSRIGLATVMFPHGAQKLFGWFGGYGWSGTYGFFTEQMGLPGIVAASVILIEFFGPILLLLGVLVRPIGLAFAGLMLGTIITVHGSHGFFMNWTGNQSGEGIEYALLAITLSLSLVFSGAGRWSIDKRLSKS